MPRNVQILSTGSYVPERVVTNAEVDALMGESTNEWLLANVGIRERRWMSPEQVTSDLIVEASKKALERAGISASDLDLIIVSTDTPDYLSPSTSVVVQSKLGADKAGCYDVNSACAGWVTALDQGAKYLMTEPTMKYILVAGGYGMSRFLDFKDKKTANFLRMVQALLCWGLAKNRVFLVAIFSRLVPSMMRWEFTRAGHIVHARRRICLNLVHPRWNSSRNSPRPSIPNTGPS